MKYKIEKITYDDGIIKYFPMVKVSFWNKWYVIQERRLGLSMQERGIARHVDTKSEAMKYVERHKSLVYEPNTIKKEIFLIDDEK